MNYRSRVLIEGEEGTAVELTLGGYEFPDMRAKGEGFDADANWLRVRGQVSDGMMTWSFDDPCLMTNEAAELATWPRGTVSGAVSPGARIGSMEGVWFVEPNVSARLDDRTPETVTIVWYFSLESSRRGLRKTSATATASR